ncbi:hypothetical protein CBR_g23932 [Chara braunii]|uniref:Uncharacterized protein n=1 Tax=Chara braunii TaxID=69332 RepID=A0A388L5A9_CHABU|nr:hypothetical protein CBR_g23932 [Chara braunii]|eukprot:GBG77485.1 hypothetical protein CBR_g23932 [Chara braunii]
MDTYTAIHRSTLVVGVSRPLLAEEIIAPTFVIRGCNYSGWMRGWVPPQLPSLANYYGSVWSIAVTAMTYHIMVSISMSPFHYSSEEFVDTDFTT